ncbi:MAG: hypothetical protein ACLU0O_12645 [Collinsella sp.]
MQYEHPRKESAVSAGQDPHKTRQPQRIPRSGNGIKQYTIEQLCRTGATSVTRARTAQQRRVVSINEQYNLLIAGHLQ